MGKKHGGLNSLYVLFGFFKDHTWRQYRPIFVRLLKPCTDKSREGWIIGILA